MSDLVVATVALAVLMRSLLFVLVAVAAVYSRDEQRRGAALKVLRLLRTGRWRLPGR